MLLHHVTQRILVDSVYHVVLSVWYSFSRLVPVLGPQSITDLGVCVVVVAQCRCEESGIAVSKSTMFHG